MSLENPLLLFKITTTSDAIKKLNQERKKINYFVENIGKYLSPKEIGRYQEESKVDYNETIKEFPGLAGMDEEQHFKSFMKTRYLNMIRKKLELNKI